MIEHAFDSFLRSESTPMSRTLLCDIADGDQLDEVLLVRDKQVRTNRNGNQYLQLELCDRTGAVSARYWNSTESESRSFESGDFLHIKGRVQSFQGQLQVIVNSFSSVTDNTLNVSDFLPATSCDVDALLAELRDFLNSMENPYLKALGQAFLIDESFLHAFSRAPAGIKNHHAYVGGLLEHVVTIMKVADRIRDLYPEIDHDLLKIGIFLHDAGKIRELSFDRGFAYTDEGQLIGHLVIGVELINDKLLVATELLGEPIPAELVCRIKHMIVSHHGTYEFGSPKLPMIPEAIALHHLDNLDAKIHNFTQTIDEDTNSDQMWTPYDPSLGRRLYKGPGGSRPPSRPADDQHADPSAASPLRGGLS